MKIRCQRSLLLILALCLGLGLQAQDTKEKERKAVDYYYRAMLAKYLGQTLEAKELLTYSYHLSPQNEEIAYQLGKIYADLSQYKEAKPLLEQAYSLDSTQQEYAFSLAMLYLSEEAVESATDLLEDWVARYPKSTEGLQLLANLYYRIGTYPKALEFYSRLQELYLEDYDVYARLHQTKVALLELSDKQGKILTEFQHLVRQFPKEVEAKFALLHYLIVREQYADARKLVNHWERSSQLDEATIRSMRLELAIGEQDKERADALLQAYLQDAKVELPSKMQLLESYAKAFDAEGGAVTESVLMAYKTLLRLYPEEKAPVVGYAGELAKIGETRKALDLVYAFAGEHPDDPVLWDRAIGYAIDLQEIDLITKISRQALAHIHSDHRYYLFSSIGYYQEEEYDKAIAVLKEGLPYLEGTSKFGLSVLLAQLGDIYSERGQIPQAYAYYDKALEANPDNASVLNNYAYFLAEAGQELEKAESMASRAVKLNGEDANALDTYAWIFYLRGKYSLAQLYQAKAIDLAKAGGEESPTFYEHYGFILEAGGQREQARESFQQAIALLHKEIAKLLEEEAKNKKELVAKRAKCAKLEQKLKDATMK